MKIRITSVDYAPPELECQIPFEVELLRKIPGTDRPDYWIAVVTKPLLWSKDGRELQIKHLIVCARWQGTEIGPGMRPIPIGIAYVVDSSVLDDSILDFKKCAYVAIGLGQEINQQKE
jgi:hypothetical protein